MVVLVNLLVDGPGAMAMRMTSRLSTIIEEYSSWQIFRQTHPGEVLREDLLRLARYFGTSAEFWMGMQATYDLETARDDIGAEIED
jgi:hypothetical protein